MSEITSERNMMSGRNNQSRGRSNISSGALITQRRMSVIIATNSQELPPNTMSYNKSDTNVDTCCLEINLCILGYTTRTANVFVYELHIKPVVTIPIVTGATAVSAVIIIFNESLYYVEKFDHSLITPTKYDIMACTSGQVHMMEMEA